MRSTVTASLRTVRRWGAWVSTRRLAICSSSLSMKRFSTLSTSSRIGMMVVSPSYRTDCGPSTTRLTARRVISTSSCQRGGSINIFTLVHSFGQAHRPGLDLTRMDSKDGTADSSRRLGHPGKSYWNLAKNGVGDSLPLCNRGAHGVRSHHRSGGTGAQIKPLWKLTSE